MRCTDPIVRITVTKSFKIAFVRADGEKSNAHNFIHMEKLDGAHNSSSGSACIMLEAGWGKQIFPRKNHCKCDFCSHSHGSNLAMSRQIQMQHVRCYISFMLLPDFYSSTSLVYKKPYSYTSDLSFKYSKYLEVPNIIISFRSVCRISDFVKLKIPNESQNVTDCTVCECE